MSTDETSFTLRMAPELTMESFSEFTRKERRNIARSLGLAFQPIPPRKTMSPPKGARVEPREPGRTREFRLAPRLTKTGRRYYKRVYIGRTVCNERHMRTALAGWRQMMLRAMA